METQLIDLNSDENYLHNYTALQLRCMLDWEGKNG